MFLGLLVGAFLAPSLAMLVPLGMTALGSRSEKAIAAAATTATLGAPVACAWIARRLPEDDEEG